MTETILIVEPVGGALRHRSLLEGRCTVASQTSPEAGFSAALTLRPRAVLISLQQIRGHGLHLCRSLRDQLGSEVSLIVYGRPTAVMRRKLLAEERRQLRARWGFDRMLRRTPTPDDIDVLLRELLRTRSSAAPERAARPRRVFSARRDDAAIAAETTWSELIRTRLDRQTLRLMWLKAAPTRG